MELKGTWVNDSRTLIYQVIPKCACSSIGQILYKADHGEFFDGTIHDARTGIWTSVNHADHDTSVRAIRETIAGGRAFSFTCVRNPYTRILSAFLDKFCRVQRSGNMYRGSLIDRIAARYEIDRVGDFDQIRAFRKFLLFVRDTMKFNHPIEPDIHWQTMASHCHYLIRAGGKLDYVFPVEDFHAGMAHVLAAAGLSDKVDLDTLPRFNDGTALHPRRAHPVEDYFDDLAEHIVRMVYGWDFGLFKYRHRPNTDGPRGPIDVTEINEKLSRWK